MMEYSEVYYGAAMGCEGEEASVCLWVRRCCDDDVRR